MAKPRSSRTGGGMTNRSHRDPHKKHWDAHKAERGTDTMHGHGGEIFKRDTNLDSKATSLTERRETAALFYDKRVIAPLWMKVSTTPWTAMAKAAGGYGRQIDDTSVSHDCPSFMHIPQVMSHKPQIGAGGYFSGSTRPAKVVHRDDTTISEDAPDWFQIPSVVAWKEGQKKNPDPGHRKLVLGKEIIFEPKMRDSKSSTASIDWTAMTARAPTTGRSESARKNIYG
mmetsp:Transcript_1860/g.3702  ORF Transcript_1860/g.3702 Transcript_1860/m.3702 type:complete len:227 (+) Transcript_1860:104-784(+)